MDTTQMKEWKGNFGIEYTKRTFKNITEIDNKYLNRYGITRSGMNKNFLLDIPISRFLEVGTNVGNQLLLLQKLGFNDLWGIEISDFAIEMAKKNTKKINIIKASALDIPFKDNFFDIVFTSGLLIHIDPSDINKVMDEIYRTSKRYIWGFEYFSDKYEQVKYRGLQNLLWKTNFAILFMDRFSNLILIKEEKYNYFIDNINYIDHMYLLEIF